MRNSVRIVIMDNTIRIMSSGILQRTPVTAGPAGRIRIEDALMLPGQKTLHSFREVSIEATDIIPGKKIDFLISLSLCHGRLVPAQWSSKVVGFCDGMRKMKLLIIAPLLSFDTTRNSR